MFVRICDKSISNAIDARASIPVPKDCTDFIGIDIHASTGEMWALFDDGANPPTQVQFTNDPDSSMQILNSSDTFTLEVDTSNPNDITEFEARIRLNAWSPVSDSVVVKDTDTVLPYFTMAYDISDVDYSEATGFYATMYIVDGYNNSNLYEIRDLTNQETYSVTWDNSDATTTTWRSLADGSIDKLQVRKTDNIYASVVDFPALLSRAGNKRVNMLNRTGKLHDSEVRNSLGALQFSVSYPPFAWRSLFGIVARQLQLSNPATVDLDCVLLEDNSITLKWLDSIGFRYELLRDADPTPISIRDGIGDVQKFNDTGLTKNTNYNYTINVFDPTSPDPIVTDSERCRTTCILPGATVLTPSGKKLIDDIRAGDIVVDEHGNHIKVIHNIRSGPNKKKVITFKRGCFGIRKPDQNLSITSNHPIKRLGKEVLVENCVNNHSIRSKSTQVSHTFTLMTEKKSFVMTNGIPVATYSQADFEKQCEDMKARGNPLLYRLL
jgi:hypothetical protein